MSSFVLVLFEIRLGLMVWCLGMDYVYLCVHVHNPAENPTKCLPNTSLACYSYAILFSLWQNRAQIDSNL
jgi:hypothetical protein